MRYRVSHTSVYYPPPKFRLENDIKFLLEKVQVLENSMPKYEFLREEMGLRSFFQFSSLYCLSATDMTYKDTFHVDPERYRVMFPKTKHLYQAFSFLLGGQPLSRATDLFRKDLSIYLRKSVHRLERQGEGERISS